MAIGINRLPAQTFKWGVCQVGVDRCIGFRQVFVAGVFASGVKTLGDDVHVAYLYGHGMLQAALAALFVIHKPQPETNI